MAKQAYNASDFVSPGLTIANFPFWGAPVLDDGKGNLSCPGFVGNTYMTNAWDVLFINGAVQDGMAPGIAEVMVNKYRDVDKKKVKGSDGARITIHGIEPAMVDIRLKIWTPMQLKKLQELWPIIFPGPQKQSTTKNGKTVETTVTVSQPFDLSHPVLQQHRVKSVIFVAGEGPNPGDTARSRIFTMRAVEFMLPSAKTNATNTPVQALGSIHDPKATSQPTPGTQPKKMGPT